MRNGLILLLLWMPLVFAAETMEPASENKAAPSAAETDVKAVKTFYEPNEVSEAGTKVTSELSEINASLVPAVEVAEMEASLPAYIDSLRTMRTGVDEKALEDYSIKWLTKAYEQAGIFRDELEKNEQTLQERVELHDRVMKRLKELETFWVATLQNAVDENAPEAIVERINKTLVRIALMRDQTKKSYDSVLTYTDMVVSENQKIKTLIGKLSETRSRLEARLFVKDREPLSAALRDNRFAFLDFFKAAFATIKDIKQTYVVYYKNNLDRVYIHMFLTALVAALMLFLHVKERRNELFVQRDEKVRGSLSFVRSPLAATVILSVLMVAAIYPERPVAVKYGNVMFALTALLLIIYRMADRKLLPYLFLLAALYAVGGLVNQIMGFELEIRLFWLATAGVMLVVFFWLLRPESFLRAYAMGKWLRFLVKLSPIVMLLLGVSLVANLFGYYHLAHKLVLATLVSLTLFVAFMVIGIVFSGLIVMFVRRRSHASEHLMQSYAQQIENNLKLISNTFLLVYWFYLVLKQFDISYFVKERYDTLMGLSWQVGDVVLSVGSLADFVIVLVITSFLTRFVRIILDLEVFSRYAFPRGVPTAIQMMIRYLIITVGILLSLSVLGIHLSDLSLIAGALGVGIGFGLRNIMANFVSGILMIFERPVQLGDVVEVGNIFGDISRIGVRATTIKTYDGSEVIVPNADFITKEVTNWTLSSKLRRIKMAYKVAFGNDPKAVIEIIRDVICKHPNIKSEPAPKVLFEGYGDYYLEFTVYFWVEERLLDVKSETAIAIYEALTDAGIRMPVPVSNVRYEGNLPNGP